MASKFGIKGDVKTMWKLPTDNMNQVTQEYIDNRNKLAIDIARNLGILN